MNRTDPARTVDREEGTAAPAAIGAYAAALQALELLKLIGGELPDALVDREVFIDAGHHRHWVTKFVRNPRCRFDHESWEIKPVAELSVAQALALADPHGGTPALSVEGDGFVTALTCPGCGIRREQSPRLRKRLAECDWICGHCEQRLLVTGFDLLEKLSVSALSARDLSASLFELGLRPGDLFCVGSGSDRCDRFQLEMPPAATNSQGATVVVVGLGNVGSQLAPLAARMPGVGRVVLIDHDSYERKNLGAQAIRAADIGRAKALAQAERLREINPALDLVAIVDRFDTVPLGFLRDAVLVACVDSRIARQDINRAAWRVGSPWIDAAVDGRELLVRVVVYRPGRQKPCLECRWDDDDYAALEQTTPCALFGAGAVDLRRSGSREAEAPSGPGKAQLAAKNLVSAAESSLALPGEWGSEVAEDAEDREEGPPTDGVRTGTVSAKWEL